jgi:gas vesicle protein
LLIYFILLSIHLKKDAVEKETKKQQMRADKLEQLSRTLQTERSNLMQQLKQYEENKKPASTVVESVEMVPKEDQQLPQSATNNVEISA